MLTQAEKEKKRENKKEPPVGANTYEGRSRFPVIHTSRLL